MSILKFLYIQISLLLGISSLFLHHQAEVKFVECSAQDFKHLLSNAEGIVVLDKVYDLERDTIVLGRDLILSFTGNGQLKNGTLVGNNVSFQTDKSSCLFENMNFEGSFIGSVKSEWFPLIYDKKVDNSKELNSALKLTHLSSRKILYLQANAVLYVKSDIQNEQYKTRDFLRIGTVELKSGVCLDLNGSTIKCLPNASKCYNILFSRSASNIKICNGIICGEADEHMGDKGEWGYGIELQGVHNFIIENIECKNCWGDGINIQVAFDGDGNPDSDLTIQGHCRNGIIKNVYCHHNRRQGISIEGIINLDVYNSRFSYTDGTNPRSGLDIEPYSFNNVVRNVFVNDCIFDNNAYSGILMMGTNVSAISIENCYFHRNKQYDFTIKGNDILISDCNDKPITLRLVDECTGVKVINSTVEKLKSVNFTDGIFQKEIEFTNCKFSDSFISDIKADCKVLYNVNYYN